MLRLVLGDFAQEPFLSAQLNVAPSLPVHNDKNNHSMSWVIAFGDFCPEGGLWIESPLGSHPPPNPTCDWQKKLRGDFIDVRNRWVSLDPSTYHAVEDVTSGTRRSLTLFSPKFWKKLSPQSLDDLGGTRILYAELCSICGSISDRFAFETLNWKSHLLHLNLPRLISLCLLQFLYVSCRIATLYLQLFKR